MPIPDSDATGLAQRLRSNTARDLIEERMRQGEQALTEAQTAAGIALGKITRTDKDTERLLLEIIQQFLDN
jgi:hypothetical protein